MNRANHYISKEIKHYVMVCSIWYEIKWNVTIKFSLFFICDVWPLQLLMNNLVLHYHICGFSAEQWFEISESKRINFILEKYISQIEKLGCSDFKCFRVWLWPLTLKGHLRLEFFIPFESPCLKWFAGLFIAWEYSLIAYKYFLFPRILLKNPWRNQQ